MYHKNIDALRRLLYIGDSVFKAQLLQTNAVSVKWLVKKSEREEGGYREEYAGADEEGGDTGEQGLYNKRISAAS